MFANHRLTISDDGEGVAPAQWWRTPGGNSIEGELVAAGSAVHSVAESTDAAAHPAEQAAAPPPADPKPRLGHPLGLLQPDAVAGGVTPPAQLVGLQQPVLDAARDAVAVAHQLGRVPVLAALDRLVLLVAGAVLLPVAQPRAGTAPPPPARPHLPLEGLHAASALVWRRRLRPIRG